MAAGDVSHFCPSTALSLRLLFARSLWAELHPETSEGTRAAISEAPEELRSTSTWWLLSPKSPCAARRPQRSHHAPNSPRRPLLTTPVRSRYRWIQLSVLSLMYFMLSGRNTSRHKCLGATGETGCPARPQKLLSGSRTPHLNYSCPLVC